jgi:hypothetical protein
MDFRDATSADLPAPRDDEPTGLRQDILDELADHLACSYNRELLRGAGPGEARRRAIERFGDPAAVARRLWLDAMRGKIMAQRVLIATCLLVMAACFGVVGLIWSQTSRSAAQAAEANRHLAELLGQTQATNQEMLRQLQAMAKPAQPAKSAEWIPVSFELTVEKPDGPPAVGYEVILGRGHGGTMKPESIHRRSDASGVADFGVVQPGDWEFTIRAGIRSTTGGLNAIPGTSILKEIVCPKSPPDRAQVKVRVDWPGPLADKDLVAVATFEPKGLTYQPPLVWGPMGSLQFNGVQIIGRARDGFIILDQDLDLSVDTEPKETPAGNRHSQAYLDRLRSQGKIHGVLLLDSSTPGEEPLEVWAGRYSLARLILFHALSDRKDTGARECELLTLMDRHDQGVQVTLPGGMMSGPVSLPLRGHRMKFSSLDQYDRFEARPGEASEWVIPLPEEMAKEVEKRLSAPRVPPSGPASAEPTPRHDTKPSTPTP